MNKYQSTMMIENWYVTSGMFFLVVRNDGMASTCVCKCILGQCHPNFWPLKMTSTIQRSEDGIWSTLDYIPSISQVWSMSILLRIKQY